jgi:hypothetical protein
MHSQKKPKEKYLQEGKDAGCSLFLIYKWGGFLKMNTYKLSTKVVGVGWLGHTLFSNVGSKGRRRLEKLLPPYLRS